MVFADMIDEKGRPESHRQEEISSSNDQGVGYKKDEITSFSHSSTRVRRISSLPPRKQDVAARLRDTRIGRVYVNWLKKYAVFRYIVYWMWRNGYPVYMNRVNPFVSSFPVRRAKRWRPLMKLREFVKEQEAGIYKVADGVEVETPAPRVFPVSDQDYLVSPHERYKFPEIFVAAIRNGLIYGGSNLVLAGETVICHDLYNFDTDYTSEELHGRTLIDPKAKRIRWLLYDDEPERIPVAATFIDACAPNYAHWLTEVLPRLAVFCADKNFREVPILVNDGLHKNIMESLFLLAGPEREVLILPMGRAVFCEKLFVTSAAGYVPFDWRNNRFSGRSHGLFSATAFEVVWKRLNSTAQVMREDVWPQKIFLRRTSEYRKILNAAEVEKFLERRGYAIIEPEKMAFAEQVRLFSNAQIVVGSSGAALANILFAPRNSKVVVLIGKQRNTIYWYWQNIACVSGKTVSYVLGKVIERLLNGAHASYVVSLEDLEACIAEAESAGSYGFKK
jgi:capsular polysaccharide biosynthesis protein